MELDLDALGGVAQEKEWGLIILFVVSFLVMTVYIIKSNSSAIKQFSEAIPKLTATLDKMFTWLDDRFDDVDEHFKTVQKNQEEISDKVESHRVTLDQHEEKIEKLENETGVRTDGINELNVNEGSNANRTKHRRRARS